jgi:hypothetical protein
MTSRRDSAVYFVLLLVAGLFGYLASHRSAEDLAAVAPSIYGLSAFELSTFEQAELELEAPFEFPYPMLKFKSRTAPKLAISGDVESVLAENRSLLLVSSTPVEVRRSENLAAMGD